MENENFGMYDSIQDLIPVFVESLEKSANHNSDYPETSIPLPEGEILTFAPGDLIVLSGAVKSGKTTVTLNMARMLGTVKNCPVGYFSPGPLEYSDLVKRFISLESGISLHKIDSGRLSYDELEVIQDASKKLYDSRLFCNQTPNLFFEELECTAQMLAEEQQVKVIFIDSLEYLQELVDADPESYRYELETLLEKIKDMAVSLNIAVVLIAGFAIDNPLHHVSMKNFRKHMIIPRTADTVLILNRQQRDDEGITTILLSVPKNAHGKPFGVGLPFEF